MKKQMKISTRMSIYFLIILALVGILFYFLLPNLLNYPPDTINTQFDKEVSKLYYRYQYAIAITGIALVFVIFFKLSLRKLDNWMEKKDRSKIDEIRELCFQYPFKMFITIEIFPICLVLITLVSTGSHPAILLFKIGILVFTVSTLVSSLFLIISKKIFYPILEETSMFSKSTYMRKKDSLVTRLIFQIFPSILMSIVLIALIGYSRLIDEKGDLLSTYYISELEAIEVDNISSGSMLLSQAEEAMQEYLLSESDFVFVQTSSGEILTTEGQTVSEFFIKYMNELSSSHDNRVYETYTIDEQGVIRTVNIGGQIYTVGIHYEVVSSSILIYFLIAVGILFIFNLFILAYMVKSINDDLTNVTNGMKNILKNPDDVKNHTLPVTSNDVVGELVNSFNEIQKLTQENIDKIHDNQNMLMERERLASLGQLISGIAHNLKTPIMSISGAMEGLNDLVNEFDASIGNPVVNDGDFHDIAKDMREWLEKVKSYTEYMSDILTAVKGQAVTLSQDMDLNFTIAELFKRVDILMKHELKKAVVNLNIFMRIDENFSIKGDVNSLVQVINNMVSNSIQAYNGKPEQHIDLIASKDDKNVIITVKDYGPGLPANVKNKLFKEMVTTKGKNGTGLGLYMSYSTIKAHFNGDITFETSSEGTEFNIILPL